MVYQVFAEGSCHGDGHVTRMRPTTLVEVELIHRRVIAIAFFQEEVQANPQVGVTQNALVLKESDHTDRNRDGGKGIGGKPAGCLEQGWVAS